VDYSFKSTGEIFKNADDKTVRGLEPADRDKINFLLRMSDKPFNYFDGKNITVNRVLRDQQALSEAKKLRGTRVHPHILTAQLDLEDEADKLLSLPSTSEERIASLVGINNIPPRVEWFFPRPQDLKSFEHLDMAAKNFNLGLNAYVHRQLNLMDPYIAVINNIMSNTIDKATIRIPFALNQINLALSTFYTAMRIRRAAGTSPTDPPVDLSDPANWMAEWNVCCNWHPISLASQTELDNSEMMMHYVTTIKHSQDRGVPNVFVKPAAGGSGSSGLPNPGRNINDSRKNNSGDKNTSNGGRGGRSNRDDVLPRSGPHDKGLNRGDGRNTNTYGPGSRKDDNKRRDSSPPRNHDHHRKRSRSDSRGRDRRRRGDSRSRSHSHHRTHHKRSKDRSSDRDHKSDTKPPKVKVEKEKTSSLSSAVFKKQNYICERDLISRLGYYPRNKNFNACQNDDCPYSHDWYKWGSTKTIEALKKIKTPTSILAPIFDQIIAKVNDFQGWSK
jgi:hypothetical protein